MTTVPSARTGAWAGDVRAVRIEPTVFAARPDYVAAIVVADGLAPGPTSAASDDLLRTAEDHATGLLADGEPHDLPAIGRWREAYADFGVKARVARSSVEALLRRAGTGLPRIDRLTDVYNAVSVLHLVPVGGEDISGYVGPPRLTIAVGVEPFDTVADGEPATQRAERGEVVWRDDAGVTCRRWNWRQCVRTRLTERTTRAVFIVDSLGPDARAVAERAAADLVVRLRVDSPDATFDTRLLGPADPGGG